MELIRVAVDGSRVSGHALAWGTALARRVGATLDVVSVFGLHGPIFVDHESEPEGPLEWWVDERQKELLAEVAGDTSDLDVRTRMLEGHPVEALLAEEEVPDLLVVGTRGVGGFVGLLVGSTAHQLIDHAPCPVAVVPDGNRAPDLPAAAVIGVDGSDVADVALRWAIDTLVELGTELTVVQATGGVVGGPSDAASNDDELQRVVVERIPEASVVRWWEAIDARPAHALVERSGDLGLLVLGLPEPEGPGGLGSVAHRCLRRATVPVVVVR